MFPKASCFLPPVCLSQAPPSKTFTSSPLAPLPPPMLSSSSPEPIRTCLFKIKPSEDGKANKTHIYYILWTKAELLAIVKYFPEVAEDHHRFAEKFKIVIQT